MPANNGKLLAGISQHCRRISSGHCRQRELDRLPDFLHRGFEARAFRRRDFHNRQQSLGAQKIPRRIAVSAAPGS